MTNVKVFQQRDAGRQLDREVAEALGWRCLATNGRGALIGKAPFGEYGVRGTIMDVPCYSTDSAAAFGIAEYANNERCFVSVTNTADGTWIAQFGTYDPVEAPTAALAICLAALASPEALVPMAVRAREAADRLIHAASISDNGPSAEANP